MSRTYCDRPITEITARELRGGAIIFLFPQTALLATPTRSHS